MHKGHLLKLFFLGFFSFFCATFLTNNTFATNNIFSNFALTAGKSTDLGIPDGKEDLFYHNNIMFYAWCPNGDDGAACDSVSGDQITWIGDSYSCGALSEIEAALPGVDMGNNPSQCTNMTSNDGSYVQGSKFFKGGGYDTLNGNPSGLTLLQDIKSKNKLRPYLVFALGTNGYNTDSNTFAGYIDELVQIAGSETKIILTTIYVTSGTVTVNDAIKAAADKYSNITVADWAAVAQPDYYSQDSSGVHPFGHYDKWVQTITDALPGNCGINIVSGGKTPEEKTWLGFRRLEYTPIQTAGIMGNIANEGGFNPISWQQGHESNWNPLRTLASNPGNTTGMGIVGFTYYTHLANLASIMEAKAPDLISILEDPNKYYKPNGNYLSATETMEELKAEFGDTRGEEIFDILLSIQILYIDYSVKDTAALEGIDWSEPVFHQHYIQYAEEDLGSPSSAALRWEWLYENHDGGTQPSRQTNAENFYNDFKDMEIPPLSGKIDSGSSSGSNSNSPNSSNSTSAGDNKDYNGDQILTDEGMALLEENQTYYQKSAEKYGIEWQIIAAIHYREHSLSRDNPNGHGPYQMPGIMQYCIDNHDASFSTNTETDDNEFQKHTDCVAHYAADYGVTDSDSVKRFFYAYNSGGNATSDKTHPYYQQAINLGFSEQEALNGEGSPYVMNMYDEKRDPRIEPTKSNNTWGQIFKDHGSMEYPASTYQYGAFVVYQALGGSTGGTSPANDCEEGGKECSTKGTEIAKMAVEMAWSAEEGASNAINPTAKQREVQNKIHGASVDYTDCGKFVAATVIESGADPDFPLSQTGAILSYLQSSDKWQEIDNWDGDESKLRDGDVLVKDNNGSGHAMIFTGKTSESKGGTWADASLGDASLGGHVGIIRNYEDSSYTAAFHAFRLKDDSNCDLSGGLTEEEAQKLADYYNSSEVQVAGFSNKNNCVGFSAFFVSWLTDLSSPDENPTAGDGYAVAGNLISRFNLPQSEGPKAFSVFSTTPDSFHSSNHTGVVVNVNEDGTVTTIESACNNSCDGGDGWGMGFPFSTGNAVVWTNQTLPNLTYAYFDDHMNSKLNEIINR